MAAEEKVVLALALMSHAAQVEESRRVDWRHEMKDLTDHITSMVHLIKVALEDACNVFKTCGPEPQVAWETRGAHATHLLDVQSEARRLDSLINRDFESYIRAFLARGAFPNLSAEEILQISTAVFSVMGLQRALLELGHAVAVVLHHESFAFYYR
ncbi:unnamed protein product [Discosporangium mesarthrocarpum]